ncbi:MAG: hypothetical protein KC613_07925 [Myxococcales bacterium]|nr:hypothetical protein [Myxococcales bacterium]
MIIADGTIFAGVLAGRGDLTALVSDLWKRRKLGAPPAVFAELLATETGARRAEQLRAWAADSPPLPVGPMGWLAAGDMVALLAGHDIRLTLVEGLVLATCVRESGQLWSLNPAFRAAAKVVPFDTFAPGGLD